MAEAFVTAADWTLESILESDIRVFKPIPRINYATLPLDEVLSTIYDYEEQGLPLILEGCQHMETWKNELNTPEWYTGCAFDENKPFESISARNIHTREDSQMTIGDLVKKMREAPERAFEGEQERWYGKDLPLPFAWAKQLGGLPSDVWFFGPRDTFRYLDDADVPENLMAYMGGPDTYTPAHKDNCASAGHNLMIYSELHSASSSSPSSSPQQPAGAFWFMTSSNDSQAASEFFRNRLGHELDLEDHLVTPEEWKQAEFTVWVCNQQVGDLVLVPRMSCHQVINHRGINIKVSWSRMSILSLVQGYKRELPIYRRVCRPEVYRVKFLIYITIKRLTDAHRSHGLTNNDYQHLSLLVQTLDEILVSEYHPNHDALVTASSDDSNIPRLRCDCCHADIFQSYLECKTCGINGDSYTICAMCYTEGRSCRCVIMEPHVLRNWATLLQVRNDARACLGGLPWSKKDLEASEHLQVFRAACQLLQNRKSRSHRGTRCSVRSKNLSHSAPSDALLPCAAHCHRACCFAHTLSERYIHAIDALLMNNAASFEAEWHKYHLGGEARWFDAEQEGTNDLRVRTTRAALDCKMMQLIGHSNRTVYGWYDEGFVEEEIAVSETLDEAETWVATNSDEEWTPVHSGRSVTKKGEWASGEKVLLVKPSTHSSSNGRAGLGTSMDPPSPRKRRKVSKATAKRTNSSANIASSPIDAESMSNIPSRDSSLPTEQPPSSSSFIPLLPANLQSLDSL